MIISNPFMIKDLFLAIILGALLGFGITGAILAIRHSKPTPTLTVSTITATPSTPAADSSITSTPTTAPTGTQTESPNIVIDAPQNYAVVANSKINLKGSTVPDSLIVVVTPIKSYSLKSNSSGNFDLDIELETGVNIVKVSAVSPDDSQSETQLIVTYSTAKI